MTGWQKRARLGLAAFGLVFAFVVYAAIGERRTSSPLERPSRLDPRAILESAGAAFQQFQAERQDYVIEAERQLTYEGGATKFIGVKITVKKRAGRDVVVSGREAQAGENQEELEVSGDVMLSASDGFIARADRATFSEADATVRVAGPVTFEKGRMSGSGIGMTYNQTSDVLTLAREARVVVTDETGAAVNEFSSGSATLARVENYLALEENVHALRGEQVLQAARGRALLSEDDEHITFIELRGDAQVAGGGTFESMTARDIDLDYTDDGATLERAQLTGGGSIRMDPGEDGDGRQFAGDLLELTFADDASLTKAIGRGGVRVDLPGAQGAPPRIVTAQTFEATGLPGQDLNAAQFAGQVEYTEQVSGKPSRVAKSNSLKTDLAGDTVTNAIFSGSVRFEDQGLQASAGQAQYNPGKGTLSLSNSDAGTGPRVSDGQIEIEASAIDLVLQGRQMTARGSVKTILRAASKNRLPGLLQQGQPANVNADSLEYDGDAGRAAYTGAAALWQGDTAIRANAIALDQTRGNLVATGNARSTIQLDGTTSVGAADEIRYDDASRTLVYAAARPPAVKPAAASPAAKPAAASPVAKPAAGAAASSPPMARLSGAQGDLTAGRIDAFLAREGSQLDRLEAHTNVTVRLEARIATGDRLTYFTDDGRYVMTGVATVPVKIVEECRETIGRTVTFFKSAERIIVDGNEEVRTQSRRGGPCPAPPAR